MSSHTTPASVHPQDPPEQDVEHDFLLGDNGIVSYDTLSIRGDSSAINAPSSYKSPQHMSPSIPRLFPPSGVSSSGSIKATFKSRLDKFFKISDRQSTIETEIRAGVITFLTMSYIVLVNPRVLHISGIPLEYGASSTCLASFCATLIVGLMGNLPVGCAPGVGLSAYFSYGMMTSLAVGETPPYQTGLGVVFLAGAFVFVLTILQVTPWLMNNIPQFIKLSTVVGMGCFLSFIGMTRMKLVVARHGEALVGLGDLDDWVVWLGLINIALIATFDILNVKGALLIGILVTGLIFFGITDTWPREIISIPHFASVGSILSFAHFPWVHAVASFLSFVLILVFDVSGCVYGIGKVANLVKENDRGVKQVEGLTSALIAASVGTMIAAMTGCSPIIVHIESMAGVYAGGRTGLTAITIAILFGLATFFSKVFGKLPDAATAPVLVFVGTLMMKQAKEINWENMKEALPAFLTIIVMPFTFSISNGIFIGIGFYLLLALTSGDLFRACGCRSIRKSSRSFSQDFVADYSPNHASKLMSAPSDDIRDARLGSMDLGKHVPIV